MQHLQPGFPIQAGEFTATKKMIIAEQVEMATNEVWSLQKRGRILSIEQTSTSFRGERKITMIFDRQ
jgi:hypothetical protein